MLKASMWQYTDTLHELTTSINRLLTNDGKVAHREQEAPLFFTIFSFPIQNEEEVIRVDEYLNDDKNFNVAVIFYKCLLFSNICYIFTLQCYYMYFIN